MNDQELNLITKMLDGLKSDFVRLEKKTEGALSAVSKKVDEFIEKHPSACFFLAWQKSTWRKVGRILLFLTVLLMIPTSVLGIAEIIRALP